MSYSSYTVPNESETVLSGMSLYYDSMYVSNGGTASDTIVDYGAYINIFSGGTADKTTVNTYGSVYVGSSGLAKNTTLNGGCSMLLYSSYASADGVTVNPGCTLILSSGAVATGVVENGGRVVVYSGATASYLPNVLSDLVASGSQQITVHSGTTAVNAELLNASMYVYSGGTATGTLLDWYGHLGVNSGGLA